MKALYIRLCYKNDIKSISLKRKSDNKYFETREMKLPHSKEHAEIIVFAFKIDDIVMNPKFSMKQHSIFQEIRSEYQKIEMRNL